MAIAFWVRSNWYVDEFWVPLPAKHAAAANCASVAIQQRNNNPDTYFVGFASLPLKHFEEPRARSFWGFGVGHDTDVWFVNVPCWFLAMVAAAAPWVRGRFSLRTLLIGMTLVAIGLGAIIVLAREPKQRTDRQDCRLPHGLATRFVRASSATIRTSSFKTAG